MGQGVREGEGGQMQANPQQMQANPQQMQANPQQMQANPQQMQANPQQMQANPQQMQANPQQMQANMQQAGLQQNQQQVNGQHANPVEGLRQQQGQGNLQGEPEIGEDWVMYNSVQEMQAEHDQAERDRLTQAIAQFMQVPAPAQVAVVHDPVALRLEKEKYFAEMKVAKKALDRIAGNYPSRHENEFSPMRMKEYYGKLRVILDTYGVLRDKLMNLQLNVPAEITKRNEFVTKIRSLEQLYNNKVTQMQGQQRDFTAAESVDTLARRKSELPPQDPANLGNEDGLPAQKAEAIRELDRWLLSELVNQGDQSEAYVVYHFLKRPMRERALVYHIMQSGKYSTISEADILVSQSEYIPKIDKVQGNLRRSKAHFIDRARGKNLRIDDLSQAIQLANNCEDTVRMHRYVKQQADAARQTITQYNQDHAQGVQATPVQVLECQRTLLFHEFMKKTGTYAQTVQAAKKGTADKTAIPLEKEIKTLLTQILRVSKDIEERAGAAQQAGPAERELERLGNGANVGDDLAESKLGLVIKGTSAVKTAGALASGGLAVRSAQLEALVTKATDAGTITEELLQKSGKVGEMAKNAAAFTDYAGMTTSGLAFLGACLGVFNYFKTVGGMTWYSTFAEAGNLLGQLSGSAGSFTTSLSHVVSMSGTLTGAATVASAASAVINTTLGVTNSINYLSEKSDRIEVQRQIAEREQANPQADYRFEKNVMKLQERINDRKGMTAGCQVISGIAAVGATTVAIVGAGNPLALLAAAGFGAIGFVASITGTILNRVIRSASYGDAIDEFLQIDDAMVNQWVGAQHPLHNLTGKAKTKALAAAKDELREHMIQSLGYKSKKAFYKHIMEQYAIKLHDKLFHSQGADFDMYKRMADSLDIYVNIQKGKPTTAVIFSKLMK